MSKFRILKLKNLSPLHIGLGRNNYDFSSAMLHSDTISSAICSIRTDMGKTDDIKSFLSSFTISSAFPFVKERLYLPLPNGLLNITIKGKKENEVRKKLKSLKYADSEIWSEIAKGDSIEIEETQINGEYLNSSLLEQNKFIKKQLTERVFVPAGTNIGTIPFFFEWTFFSKDAGLYVMVDAPDDIFHEIKTLMQELGIHGVGSDRNIGGGHFEISDETVNISTPNNANAQMLFSLFIPKEEEIIKLNLSEANYSLKQRSGFMAGSNIESFRHLRKKSIYMFEEGSVFQTENEFKGKIVNLAPLWNDKRMHQVLRSGKPFFLPINHK